MTGAEIQAAHEALETGAALALGHMLFEFSRLDMNLGLCLVWAGDPEKMQSLSRGTGEMAVNDKLNELTKLVNAKLLAGSKRHTAYTEWIRRAHIVRQKRNDLVHGRWGVEVQKSKVVNGVIVLSVHFSAVKLNFLFENNNLEFATQLDTYSFPRINSSGKAQNVAR